VAGLVAAAVFASTSPFLIVNPRTRGFLVMVAHIVLPGVFGEPVAGASEVPAPLAWLRHAAFRYHFVFSLRYGAGIVVTALAPLAVAWALVDGRALLRLSAVFALFYYLVMGASPVLARHLTPLPVVALLVSVRGRHRDADGVDTLAPAGARRHGVADAAAARCGCGARPLTRPDPACSPPSGSPHARGARRRRGRSWAWGGRRCRRASPTSRSPDAARVEARADYCSRTITCCSLPTSMRRRSRR
jgi:hypothetical protein